jgi:hypothetical protein
VRETQRESNHRELHEADGVAALLDVLRGGGGAEAALVRALRKGVLRVS